MKTLRLNKQWSQEQLAQLSGLNVRTIQRIEKGERVGIETLKSLAAVFEIPSEELKKSLDDERQQLETNSVVDANEQSQLKDAQDTAKSIKQFYIFAFSLCLLFALLIPLYIQEGSLSTIFLMFSPLALGLGVYAYTVFQPFGKNWEKRKAQQLLNQQRDADKIE